MRLTLEPPLLAKVSFEPRQSSIRVGWRQGDAVGLRGYGVATTYLLWRSGNTTGICADGMKVVIVPTVRSWKSIRTVNVQLSYLSLIRNQTRAAFGPKPLPPFL